MRRTLGHPSGLFLNKVVKNVYTRFDVLAVHVQGTDEVVYPTREIELLLDPVAHLFFAQLRPAELLDPRMLPKRPPLSHHVFEFFGKLLTRTCYMSTPLQFVTPAYPLLVPFTHG